MRGTAWRLLTAAALCAATSRGEAQAARDAAGPGSAARTAVAADRSGGAVRFVTGGADSAAANSSVTDSFGSNTPASDTSASATSGSAKSVTGNSPTDSSTADSSAAGPRLSAMGPSFRPDTGGTRPRAIEYSDAYGTRLAIHRYASYAELPLFAAEFALGQRILNGERTGDRASSGTRSAHSAVAGGLGVLFAVNTV
ncbi:MAG TPA: hypothetical protein VHR43_17815, partial [Gemmatimonadales bacterium]|nr:hypothetical protein [Gemmatimonadales bacterium]